MNGPSPTSALRPLYLELRISIGRVFWNRLNVQFVGRAANVPPIHTVLGAVVEA
jgi:hypothetical protein